MSEAHNTQPTGAPTPTPATTWKRTARTGEPYTLPGCGHTALLRRPGLTGMAAQAGHIPNPLSAAVLRFLAYNDDTARPTETQMIAAYQKNSRAFAEIARLCFVYPILVLDKKQCSDCGHAWDGTDRACPACQSAKIAPAEPNEEAGEIGADYLTDRDYVWIVSKLVEGEAADLANFRQPGGTRTT